MELLPESVHRALVYIRGLNTYGVLPPRELVDEFNDSHRRRVERVGGFSIQEAAKTALFGQVRYLETFTDSLVRLGWADADDEGVRLTDMGVALVKALNWLESSGSDDDVQEVYLDAKDEFAYPKVLHVIANAGEALLVDPYLDTPHFLDIVGLGSIKRILVGTKHKMKLQNLATALAHIEDGRIEIRKAPSLHDRYVIPTNTSKPVLMMGASLNNFGSSNAKTTVVTQLMEDVSTSLRRDYEKRWKDADVLKPLPTAHEGD